VTTRTDSPAARDGGAHHRAAVIAVTIIIFALLWGGLVPPACAEQHASGINPAVIPPTLALWAASACLSSGAHRVHD
jgi:hypothetical protein